MRTIYGNRCLAFSPWWAIALLFVGCAAPTSRPSGGTAASPGFLAVEKFNDFQEVPGDTPGERVLMSPVIPAPFAWDELVVSWNGRTPRGAGLKVEVRAIYPGRTTKFYTMGWWAEDTAERPRRSVNGQKDTNGDVETDTLVLETPAQQLQARITSFADENGSWPVLRFLGFSVANRKQPAHEIRLTNPVVKCLPVPELSQRSYPGGRDWCSPTSVAMVLRYWAATLQRPEWKLDVPEVAAGVFDPSWPGTGNWAFNTAFAGSLPGLRAYVARLAGEEDLQTLLTAGVPPILSVSLDLLNGRPRDEGSGHLIVFLGFDERGDFIVNDPWAQLEKGEKVRRVIARAAARRAWDHSRRTVYLIYPEAWPLPPERFGRW